MNDALGDRMKFYEGTMLDNTKLLPKIPVIARLDGVSFHRYTKNLKRPFDEKLSQAMIDTTKILCEKTNALIAYTQSDEISLMWLVDGFKSQMWFDGKVQKIASVLASMCSVTFNQCRVNDSNLDAYFDCRVWNVPTKQEAVNYFLWRQNDATRNSITMAASCYYSHNQLQGKNGNEKQEMLFASGVNWNDYPYHFKRGTFVRKIKKNVAFSPDELSELPLKHEAVKNPGLSFQRSEIIQVDLPKITTITNAVDVFFNGDDVDVDDIRTTE